MQGILQGCRLSLFQARVLSVCADPGFGPDAAAVLYDSASALKVHFPVWPVEENVLTSDRVSAFRELAAFLRREKILSCVLHGIDPESGVLGRDLDLYIPDSQQAYRAAVRFSEILRQRGVRWVALMHPIWGPRCIAIQESDLSYCELHVISKINMACIDFGGLFPIRGTKGPLGYDFDPSLWFIKAVLQKYSSSFAHCRPALTRVPCDAYALARKTEIGNEFQSRWRNGAEFVSAALGPDTDANLRTRRKGLYAILAENCLAHPGNAARAVVRWLHLKESVYRCASVPFFGIDTTMESSALRDLLLEKLGHVFVEIVVADQSMSRHAIRRLQARQFLIVLRRNQGQGKPESIDNWITISADYPEEIDAGVAAILDAVVQYSERWNTIYRIRALDDKKRTVTGAYKH